MMPTYKCTWIQQDGDLETGCFFAKNRRMLRENFLKRNQIVLSMHFCFSWKTGLSEKQSLLFWKSLSRFLKARMPLGAALKHLAHHFSPPFSNLSSEMARASEEGEAFSCIVKRVMPSHDSLVFGLLKAGEETGQLADFCCAIERFLEQKFSFLRQKREGMRYPIFLLLLCFVVGGAFSCTILPELENFTQGLEASSSWATRSLLYVSGGISHYGLPVLFGSIFMGLLASGIARMSLVVRKKIESLFLKIPMFGKMRVCGEIGYLLQIWSLLIAQGMTIRQIFPILTACTSLYATREDLEMLGTRISAGQAVPEALALSSLFSLGVGKALVATYAYDGDLAGGLQAAGKLYQEDYRTFQKAFLASLQPLGLLIVGSLLLWFIAGGILPLYQTSGALSF